MNRIYAVVIIFFLLTVPVYSQDDKVNTEERLQLENYLLKLNQINYQLSILKAQGDELSEKYQSYFKLLQKKYNNSNNIDVQTGNFVKELKDK